MVLDDLGPVVAAEDEDLSSVVERKVAAVTAQQGLEGAVLTSQQISYIAALATQQVIPRLINLFMRKMQEMKGGPAEAKYVDLVEALKLLYKTVDATVKQVAKDADPADLEDVAVRRPPMSGPRAI